MNILYTPNPLAQKIKKREKKKKSHYSMSEYLLNFRCNYKKEHVCICVRVSAHTYKKAMCNKKAMCQQLII